MKLEHSLTLCTKINSKQFKHLNVRPETIRLLEEDIGRTLIHIHTHTHTRTHTHTDLSPKAKEIQKTKINKCNLIKL